MRPLTNIALICLLTCFMACNVKKSGQATQAETPIQVEMKSKADTVLMSAIEAHGGSLYDQASYSFVFRGKKYSFTNDGNEFVYQVENSKEGDVTLDVIDNGNFTRFENDKKVSLSEKEIAAYTGSLNSVIYFVTLPHKLQDKAVKKAYKGMDSIKGEPYDMLEITFEKEGGGTDHDDEFYYWIHKDKKTIDYLAYNYQVNEGGVRFRSAYNPRVVEGIRFQDYVNYKAPVGTPLQDLSRWYEKGELEELSRIETEEVVRLESTDDEI